MDKKKCAVTGQVTWSKLSLKENDPDYIIIKRMLKEAMVDLLEKKGVGEYIIGLTSIVQLCAAEIALELQPHYPDLVLSYIEAYEVQGYACYNSSKLVNRYLRVVESCNNRITLQKRYSEGCETRQQAYIAGHSDMVLGIWRHLILRKNSIISVAVNSGIPAYCIDQSNGQIALIHKEGTKIVRNQGIIIGSESIDGNS